MPEPEEQVTFERVTEDDGTRSESSTEAVEPSTGRNGSGHDIEEADVRAFDQDSFPLAGPILEGSKRVLKGRCSSCDRRLRVRVESRGPVRVRCPICGHARRISVP